MSHPIVFCKNGFPKKNMTQELLFKKIRGRKIRMNPWNAVILSRPLGSNIANCSYHPKKYREFNECRFSLIFHVREIVYMEHRDV